MIVYRVSMIPKDQFVAFEYNGKQVYRKEGTTYSWHDAIKALIEAGATELQGIIDEHVT